MSNFMQRVSLSAALAAAALLGAATPSHAQTGRLISGAGRIEIPGAVPIGLYLQLNQLPGGVLRGAGAQIFTSSGGRVTYDLTSFLFIGETLCMAGPITSAVNAPPPYTVGSTIVFCIQDNNKSKGTPDAVAGGVGPPNLTIQQIIAMAGPPPPQAFVPLVSGDFTIH